jgi:hypothetical protein
MTLLQRYLAHYVAICLRGKTEKANAWLLANAAAQTYPEHLADLPAQLTAEMLRLQGLSASEGATAKPETLPGPGT